MHFADKRMHVALGAFKDTVRTFIPSHRLVTGTPFLVE